MTRTPKSAWIEAASHALAAGGPEAVRVETLARVLGVTKGGFYWHFEDRQALLDAVLAEWEARMVDAAIAVVDNEPGDARAKLRRLFTVATSAGIDIELAVRDWARRDPEVAARLRRVDNRRMAYLRSLFSQFCSDAADVEARCLLVTTLWIGSHFISVDHPRRSASAVLKRSFEHLLA